MAYYFYGICLGGISGLIWSFALSSPIGKTAAIGTLIGFLVGGLLGMMGDKASERGNVNQSESAFVGGSFMAVIFMASIVVAALIALFRWVF